jgi:DNA-binding transcriptional LysR family regulator
VQSGQIGKVSLAFVDTAVNTVLPDLMRTHRNRYPTIQVTMRQLSPSRQLEALMAGDLQVGLLRHERAGREVMFERLITERLVVAVPRSHVLAKDEPVDLREFEGEAFVLFPRTLAPSLHDFIIGLFRKAGYSPRIVQEAPEQHTLIGLVAAGVGLSITTDAWRNWAPREVVYRQIDDPAASLPLLMAWRRDERSPVVKLFLDLAREVAANYTLTSRQTVRHEDKGPTRDV